MNYFLTEEQQAIQETAREIAQKKIKPVREHYDVSEEYPWPIVEELRKADLFGVYFPTQYGGLGGAGFELCLVVEEISRVCGGTALTIACTALCAFPIILFGTPKQKEKYLPDLASGKRLGAFTITEPEAGSDATATSCKAKKEGDYYVLNGTKNFCSNGNAAEIYTLFASTNPARGPRGLSAFIVEKGTPGFSMGKKEVKMGIRASPTYELNFDNCKVPAENFLGGEGHGLSVAQGTFDISRPGVAAQALGIAQGALDEALNYARMRKQFGQSVLSFQSSQHMAADMATQIEAARSLLYSVTRAMDKDLLAAEALSEKSGKTVYEELKKVSSKRWTKYSAMVKLFCSDVAMKVTTDAVQLCGGIGYMRDFPVEKYMRDAKITQIYEGTNQIQRNEIGYALIKELAKG
ncbi:MAG: acyl-CoA dehydrogenase family protein [Elusimicrobia bacterium]|nr:acyl-CoA dehydrogenase family protein [Elusimicrobiota bacterium]MBI2915266.1 acyl-CoA dehydrogenase family protein [Elusimicrobiota bacterium]MBI3012703.1 acyl-CoA dehydrogenase family protein [Elusimicrobiota bacterium]